MEAIVTSYRLLQSRALFYRRACFLTNLVIIKQTAELEKSAVMRDKNPKEELRRREEYFRALIEHSLDIIFVVDKKGTINYVSPSVERFLGYKPADLIGKSGFRFIVPTDLPRAVYEFGKAILTKEVVIPNSFRIRRKDGLECVLEGVGKNLLDNPSVGGFVMNVRDITGRRRAEEALRERELELGIKTENLEEANIALKVLLKRRDEDRAELEDKIILNVRELVAPYLDKLRMS